MMDPVSPLLEAVEILKLPGTMDVIFAEWVSYATVQRKKMTPLANIPSKLGRPI